ncbi:hypothetical protein D5S17_21255 [Pseudonocardiaceae bacterium YIM PH 21723]|nr:hypothetical protein D5S17_21255 [Pseudonocardiaceae bacterium YIM PH 21723]
MTESRPHALFSFGTLRDDRVQTSLFGRTVPGAPAALVGYATRPVVITDPEVIATSGLDVHLTLVRRLGGEVEGGVLRLTDAELAAADDYEVDDYRRRRVHLSTGENAWAYLDANPLRAAVRIAIVGDSIAYGRCDTAGGWAGRLAATHIAADEQANRVFNLAIPGSTLQDVGVQLPALLPPRLPDTVLLAAGIDDSAQPGTCWPDQALAGLDSAAATARQSNARLVVLGPTWLDEDRAPTEEGLRFTRQRALTLRESMSRWCTGNHIDFLDMWEPLRDRPDLLADGLHPTAGGHELLYKYLARSLA